jgi:hypothetical protein
MKPADTGKPGRISQKLLIFCFFLIFCSISGIYGQRRNDDTPPLKERIFFGGQLGLQFGTYTNIQVAPLVGLWVRPRIAIAAGPNYQYLKYLSLKTSIYGGNFYTEYVAVQDFNNVIPLGVHLGLFLHLEDELLNMQNQVVNYYSTDPYSRFTMNTILAGCGISQPLGGRATMRLIFLWPLNNTQYGFYSDPEIRINFTF